MALAQPSTDQRDWKVAAAAFLMLVSGIIHFIIIPHHWEHAPAHGLTMGVIGVLEVAWAVVYWLRPSKRLAQTGVVLAVSLIALWTITRIAPAPYTNEPEEVDFSGVLTKGLEAASAAALLAVVVSAAPQTGSGRAIWQTAVSFVLFSVVLAAATYEAARLTQPLFPQLNPPAMENMDNMDMPPTE